MTDNRTPSPGGPPATAWPPDRLHATPPQPGPPGRRGHGRARRRVVRRLVAAVAVVGVALLLAPTPLVRPIADRAARGYESQCARMTGVDVDPGSWPVVARAALGRLRGVSTHADEVRFDNGVAFHDVDFAADEVNGSPLRFGVASPDAQIRGGTSSATVRLDDIERNLASEGVTVDLRVEEGALIADVEAPIVGVVPTAVDVVPVDGDLELRFAPFDAFPLPPLRIALPEPVVLQDVAIGEDGIRVSSTVEGTVAGEHWGCSTASPPPSA